jgi:hypothetical protein
MMQARSAIPFFTVVLAFTALGPPLVAQTFNLATDSRQIVALNGLMRFQPGDDPQLPADIVHPGQPLTLALRIWSWPWQSAAPSGLQGTMQFGDATLIRDWQTYQERNTFWTNTQSYLVCALCLLAALGAFMLFFMRPSDREYLWFGIFELFNAIYELIDIYLSLNAQNMHLAILLGGGIILVLNLSLATFVRHFLKIGRTRLYWAIIVAAICNALVFALASLSIVSYLQFITGQAASLVVLVALGCVLLFTGPEDGPADIRALAVPLALFGVNLIALYVGLVLQVNGFAWITRYLSIYNRATTRPFPLGTFEICKIIVQLTLFAILLLRFVRTRRDEERFKNELEAARIVQSILVPQEIPSIPGFSIESVYKPASQVGGDFFQIIPISDNGALVAIGDVSGKGTPAAMTVSLLVGTLRTLVYYTQRPSEILAAMNRRMLARSAGGFTTCLVLTFAADGTLSVANAGHLAPYLDGRELPITNDLPLGLSGDADYTECTFRVADSEQLTLMTDGVAEARAKNGELLGFDRAADLSTGSAESIADAAQTFGQQDDITVVTLKRVPLPASVHVSIAAKVPAAVSAPEPI